MEVRFCVQNTYIKIIKWVDNFKFSNNSIRVFFSIFNFIFSKKIVIFRAFFDFKKTLFDKVIWLLIKTENKTWILILLISNWILLELRSKKIYDSGIQMSCLKILIRFMTNLWISNNQPRTDIIFILTNIQLLK